MKFHENLEALKQGRKIRKKTWSNLVYIKVESNQLLLKDHDNIVEFNWKFSYQQMLDDDWVIVDVDDDWTLKGKIFFSTNDFSHIEQLKEKIKSDLFELSRMTVSKEKIEEILDKRFGF